MPYRSPTVRAVAALSLTQLIGWGATFGPHAALWLAFVISVFAFCALLGLLLLHRRMELNAD